MNAPGIRVVYLGRLAEIAGRPDSELRLAGAEIGWSDLAGLLDSHGIGGLGDAMQDPRVKVALNGEVLARREDLKASHGDEIALLPPVSGG